MKLWNKLLTREAQAPLFSSEEITGEEVEKKEIPRPVRATSPFRKGLKDLSDKLNKPNRPRGLPDDITMPIVNAAEKVKTAHA